MIGTLGRLFNPARSLHNWVDERNARQAAERASAEQAAWNAQLQSIADQQEWGGALREPAKKQGLRVCASCTRVDCTLIVANWKTHRHDKWSSGRREEHEEQ